MAQREWFLGDHDCTLSPQQTKSCSHSPSSEQPWDADIPASNRGSGYVPHDKGLTQFLLTREQGGLPTLRYL